MFDGIDTSELLSRYNYLITNYTKLASEIAPLLEKFGKMKSELELLTSEFISRGVKIEDPKELKDWIESQLEATKDGKNPDQKT